MKHRIIDIDNCISNDAHRRHFADKRDWDAYHGFMHLDPPANRWVVNGAPRGTGLMFFSSAPEAYRGDRVRWLQRHFPVALANAPWMLYLRDDDDDRPSVDVKRDMLIEALWRGIDLVDITMAVDDRDDVLAMYKRFRLNTRKVVARCDGNRDEGIPS